MPVARAAARPGLVIGVLVSGGFVVSVMQTLVVPVLGRFPEILHASLADVTWLVTVTLLSGAIFTPVLGRLADLHGKRRILVAGLVLMTAGSLLGAVASSLAVMLVARGLQGASVAVVAVGTSIMRDVLPPRRLIGGVAIMSSSLGFGGAVGLPLSGVIAQFLDWRWLFAGPAVLGLLLVVVTLLVVPESPVRAAGGFDPWGAVLLAGTLLCLLLAVAKGSAWGWGSARVLGLLAGSVVFALVWVRAALTARWPLVDLRTATSRPVLLTHLAGLVIGFAMYVGFLATPQVLQGDPALTYGFGLAPATAGLAMIPMGATMAAFSPVAAMISRRSGAATSLLLGCAVVALACGVMAARPPLVAMVVGCCVVSAVGTSLALSALPVLIMDAVPPGETAAANAVNSLVRVVGTSTSSAFLAAVTASASLTLHVGDRVVPSGATYTVAFAAGTAAALLGVGFALPAWWRSRPTGPDAAARRLVEAGPGSYRAT